LHLFIHRKSKRKYPHSLKSGRASQTIRRRADRTATMAGSFALNDTDTGGVILFGLLMGTRPL